MNFREDYTISRKALLSYWMNDILDNPKLNAWRRGSREFAMEKLDDKVSTFHYKNNRKRKRKTKCRLCFLSYTSFIKLVLRHIE